MSPGPAGSPSGQHGSASGPSFPMDTGGGIGYGYRPETTGTPPRRRAYHSVTLIGHRIFVYGGCESTEYGNIPFDDLHVLDLDAMAWLDFRVAGNPPGPRCKHTGVAIDGVLYIYGGWDGARRMSSLHALDTVCEPMRWFLPASEAAAAKANPHSSHAACAVGDTMVVVGRGETGTHKKYGCDIDFFHTDSGKWTLGGARFASRAGHSVSFLPLTDSLMLFGGRKEEPVLFSTLHRMSTDVSMDYDEEERVVSIDLGVETGPPYGRSFHGVTQSGTFVVVHGGFCEGRNMKALWDATDEIHVYEEQSGRWFAPAYLQGSLPPRAAFGALNIGPLPDGGLGLILFGGTHESEVFNDLWLVPLKEAEEGEEVVYEPAPVSALAALNPTEWTAELTQERRARQATEAAERRDQENERRRALNRDRDRRGEEMRRRLREKEIEQAEAVREKLQRKLRQSEQARGRGR